MKQNDFYEDENSSSSLKRKLEFQGDDNIQMAVILFRSMEGRQRALAAYDKVKTTLRSFLYSVVCCPCNLCCRKVYKRVCNVEDLDMESEAAYYSSDDPQKLKFMD